MEKQYYVYMMANRYQGSIYVGVTNDLLRRVYEHKTKTKKGFTEKYKAGLLVYFEETSDAQSALQREKQLKKWKREWKIALIEEKNPHWKDLWINIGGFNIHQDD